MGSLLSRLSTLFRRPQPRVITVIRMGSRIQTFGRIS